MFENQSKFRTSIGSARQLARALRLTATRRAVLHGDRPRGWTRVSGV